MNVIRRLVNSWCKFKIKKNGLNLIDYAKEKKFKSALELFASLEIQMVIIYVIDIKINIIFTYKIKTKGSMLCSFSVQFGKNTKYNQKQIP